LLSLKKISTFASFSYKEKHRQMYQHGIKRILDFLIALVAILFLSPLLLLTTLGLTLANHGAGAFFMQERPGLHGQIFRIYKFKTMTDECGEDGLLLPDKERLTRIGKIVRAMSIDELPQLINVLMGDMSLIGPRPLLVHYLPWYTPEQARRHEVRPGITGWAQVNGRNHCKLSQKFEYDVWYVDHCSLRTDLLIIKKTIVNVLRKSDVGTGNGDMAEVDDLGFHQRYLELIGQSAPTKEYGSEYHNCPYPTRSHPQDNPLIRNYANGRQALIEIIRHNHWKRMWAPIYFCQEVLTDVHRQTGITICFYNDYPGCTDDHANVLPYEEGDVLLRMNYFGLRSFSTSAVYGVPVIEDHSHGLTTPWAIDSDADWCFASIRKTLPLAAGGILWSPKHHSLPEAIATTCACEEIASQRYQAMEMKGNYLAHGGNKSSYLSLFHTTEEALCQLAPSGMDSRSLQIFQTIDIVLWMEQRQRNWKKACQILSPRWEIVGRNTQIEDKAILPFSIAILTQNAGEREQLRGYLLQHDIYPAILWDIPRDNDFSEAQDVASRIISIHCDARYTEADMEEMCQTINAYYD